jgi:hypothetical protein
VGIEVQRIWINLGGEWMLWPRESLYGNIVDGASASDDAWFDGLLKSQGDDFPFFILGAVRMNSTSAKPLDQQCEYRFSSRGIMSTLMRIPVHQR